MHGLWTLVAAAGMAAAVSAAAQTPAPSTPPPKATPPAVTPLPPDTVVIKQGPPQLGAGARSFGFTHVIFRLPAGDQWMNRKGGMFCAPQGVSTWPGGQAAESITAYMDTLRPQMKDAGFSVDGDPDNVFAPTASTSDLQLAAIVTELHLDFCQQYAGYTATTVTGTASMSVQWEVYSTIQKTIIAKVNTSGDSKADQATHGTLNTLMMGAFRENVAQLITSSTFKSALMSTPSDAASVVKATMQQQPPIALPGALAAKPRPVADIVGSVVMITAGQAQGSGFLISSDGMLLTDQHVVGEAKYVKVRWPDGIEGLGEVVRSDKTRDVALVKTDPRGRTPIRLRRDPMQPGDTVFAIGAPLDAKFQSTVTRGVVSAYRTFEGVSFIQSDVSVTFGSSGGPLLDEHGEVIGLTESGFMVPGAPSGINLFVPIGDALDFLSAQPQ